MKKIDIKFLLNSDIRSILEEYTDKNILYSFLLYIIKDTKKYYDNIKYKDVLIAQDKIIELLEDLLLNKEIPKKDLDAAANAAAYAAANAAYAATTADAAYAAADADAAYAAADAANAAANAAYAAANAAYAAAYAAYAAANAATATAKQKEYKEHLIELILEENKISIKAYRLLFKGKNEKR